MVQRALNIDTENKLSIDSLIIGCKSKRDMKNITLSMQTKYLTGFSLEKIAVKLYDYFNWKYFEYYPVEECKEKYLFIKKHYEKFGNKRSVKYTQTLAAIQKMIDYFDEEKTL